MYCPVKQELWDILDSKQSFLHYIIKKMLRLLHFPSQMYTTIIFTNASYSYILATRCVKDRQDIFFRLFLQLKNVRRTFCIRPKIIQTDEVMHSFASFLHKQYSLRFLSGLRGDFIGWNIVLSSFMAEAKHYSSGMHIILHTRLIRLGMN